MVDPVAGRASYNYRLFMNAPDKHATRKSRTFPPKSNFWIRFILGAIAVSLIWFFFDRPKASELTGVEQEQLLSLAREQLVASVSGEGPINMYPPELSENTLRDGAAFVSLTIDGASRGCMIDQFEPHEPLVVNVLRNVELAAGADERFPPLTPEEIDRVHIAISVVYDIASLTDGVILELDGEIATYLPSVWQIFPAPADFLSQLCIKAGWNADRWRKEPFPSVRTYHVFDFGEGE